MNLRQMKVSQIALLLNGLRATHVMDQVDEKTKLEKLLEGILAERGARLVS
jgi:hypothetical protein